MFRVDSGTHIGLGHLARCLTLADAWPGPTRLVSRAFDGHARAWIDGRHPLRTLPPPTVPAGTESSDGEDPWLRVPIEHDVRQTVAAIADVAGPAVLVVDHYGIDARWHRAFGRARPDIALAAIDDLADRPHDVELLLDQSPGRAAQDYAGRVPPWAAVLAGTRFALLGPRFAAARWTDHPSRLLLSLGGLDSAGHHRSVLGWLAELRDDPSGAFRFEVDLPIAAAAPHLPRLVELAGRWPWLHLHVDAPDMAELLAGARLAIGAPGTSALERCAVGTPTVQIVVADNQRGNAAALHDAGAALTTPLERTALLDAVRTLWLDGDARRRMSSAARAVCDGRGTAAVVAAMAGLSPVLLRPAGEEDGDLLYAWQHEAGARTYARTSTAPSVAEHRAWFAAVLADPGRHLWLAQVAGEAMGMVRFDDAAGEVSILLARAARGRGLAAPTLRALRRHLPDRTLRAEIHPDNAASRRAFRRAGYRAVDATWFELEPCCAPIGPTP